MSKLVHFTDISEIMTMKGAVSKTARMPGVQDLGLIPKASLVVEDGRVLWVGPSQRLPKKFSKVKTQSLGGAYVYPGFVDCHTHLAFDGNRMDEFELRNKGVSYQEIAQQGGGIRSTVKATRRASQKKLTDLAQERLGLFISQGVTTVEVKSGYGLNESAELKMLRAIQDLKEARVVSTYLGAHAIPKEFPGEGEYLLSLLETLKKIKAKDLSHRVDIFVEKNYFSVDGARKYLNVAKDMGFDLTIHADQLSRTKATLLAIEMGARSADHVVCLNKKDIRLLAASETTAVLLPAADFYIHCPYPDARGLLDQGGRCALGTDFNPGSSPTQSLALVGLLARLKMKMSLPEVFVAHTLGGAYALGLENECGALVSEHSADFFSSAQSWKHFFYSGQNPTVCGVWYKGRKVFNTSFRNAKGQ